MRVVSAALWNARQNCRRCFMFSVISFAPSSSPATESSPATSTTRVCATSMQSVPQNCRQQTQVLLPGMQLKIVEP